MGRAKKKGEAVMVCPFVSYGLCAPPSFGSSLCSNKQGKAESTGNRN